MPHDLSRIRILVGAITGATVCSMALVTSAVASGPEAPAAAPTRPKASSSSTAVTAPVSRELRADVLPNGRTSATRSQLARWGGDPRVASYWTTKRMRSAIPLDTPEPGPAVRSELERLRADQASTAVRTVSRPVAAKGPAVTPRAVPRVRGDAVTPQAAPPPVTNFSRTNGKVYFRNATNGRNYVCSGSALNSTSKRLVITAGHCVHGGRGGTWHTNWQFVPAYHRGARPYGTFQAATLRTYTDWIDYGESGRGFNSDVGFVTTFDNASGRRVVDTVGGHGARYGGSRVFDVSIFGYPGNLDQGQVMWACWGTTGTRWTGAYLFSTLSGCNFGGGSSGGPWLDSYSNSSGLGYVRSVTSHGPRASTAYINGPYFDSRFPGLLNSANDDW